jgi:hypothetical protein
MRIRRSSKIRMPPYLRFLPQPATRIRIRRMLEALPRCQQPMALPQARTQPARTSRRRIVQGSSKRYPRALPRRYPPWLQFHPSLQRHLLCRLHPLRLPRLLHQRRLLRLFHLSLRFRPLLQLRLSPRLHLSPQLHLLLLRHLSRRPHLSFQLRPSRRHRLKPNPHRTVWLM